MDDAQHVNINIKMGKQLMPIWEWTEKFIEYSKL